MNLDEMLNKVLDHLKTSATTETVIGQQFKLGEFTCVPVIKVSMGFGSGGGEGTAEKQGQGTGGASGGGMQVQPVGFLVTNGNEISLLDVGKSKGIAGIFDKVPDLMEKIMEMKAKQEKEEK